jgi:hypothetical protein
MNKLFYHSHGETVSVDLKNNYTIFANALYNNETKKYEVTFYIKRNDIDILDLIEKQENIEFETDRSTIKAAILKHTATLLSQGFYDYYIRRYEYMMDCFDRGNALFEQESLENAG